MIYVTRLNESQFVVNADFIKTVEGTPDTVLTLYNDDKFVVKETVAEIVDRVIAFRRSLYREMISLERGSLSAEKTRPAAETA